MRPILVFFQTQSARRPLTPLFASITSATTSSPAPGVTRIRPSNPGHNFRGRSATPAYSGTVIDLRYALCRGPDLSKFRRPYQESYLARKWCYTIMKTGSGNILVHVLAYNPSALYPLLVVTELEPKCAHSELYRKAGVPGS